MSDDSTMLRQMLLMLHARVARTAQDAIAEMAGRLAASEREQDRLRAALERIARDDGRGPLSLRNEARRALNHD